MKSTIRPGFTLLEVVLSIGILTGCAILLGELVGIGRRHADSAQILTEAQILCENQLARVLSGIAPLERIDRGQIPDAPDWEYSVAVDPVADTALVAVTVFVHRPEGTEARRPREFSLVRWIRRGGVSEAMPGQDGSSLPQRQVRTSRTATGVSPTGIRP